MFESESFVASMGIVAGDQPAPIPMPIGQAKSIGAGKAGVSIRTALASNQPGAWATDHRAETEHFTGWNYVLIQLLAQQVAQADCRAYEDPAEQAVFSRAKRRAKRFTAVSLVKAYQDDSNGESLPITHPVMQLISKPNPHQSGAMFQMERVIQLRTTGQVLTWHVPSKGGKVAERYVIPTAMAQPVGASKDLPRGGWKIQSLSAWGGDGWASMGSTSLSMVAGKIIPAEQMQVIRLPHPLFKDDGLSPLAAASVQVDTAEQVDFARHSSMKNGFDPSMWIAFPKESDVGEPELKRVQAMLKASYGGPANAGKAFITTGGATATPLSNTPKDMGYQEGWIQSRDFLAALHGTPISMLTADGYASLYAGLTQFNTFAVQPTLDMLAEEDTRYLSPFYGDTLSIEYAAQPVNDADVIEKQLLTDITAKAITVDEIRISRGREPWGGERGEEIAGTPAQLPTSHPVTYQDTAKTLQWLAKCGGPGSGRPGPCPEGGGRDSRPRVSRTPGKRQKPPAPKKDSDRSARARAAYNPSTKAKQDESEALEHKVTKALGATKSGDNRPMDVTAKNDTVGIEVKMLHDAKEQRVNMRPDSRGRKEEWIAEKKGRRAYTVVVDNRDKFDGGRHADKYSGHRIYYKEGVGAFGLSTMHRASSLADLKTKIGL